MSQPHTRRGGQVVPHDLGPSHDLPQIIEGRRAGLGRWGPLGLFGGWGRRRLPAAPQTPPPRPRPPGPRQARAVLATAAVTRRDITSSFGAASGVAEGVPVTVRGVVG